MTEAEVRVPTTDDQVRDVREGVEAVVRDALAKAANLHERADATLERYDEIVHEMTTLRSEIFGLRKDIAEIPARLQTARLDAMLPNGGGDDAALLERRYVAVRPSDGATVTGGKLVKPRQQRWSPSDCW